MRGPRRTCEDYIHLERQAAAKFKYPRFTVRRFTSKAHLAIYDNEKPGEHPDVITLAEIESWSCKDGRP